MLLLSSDQPHLKEESENSQGLRFRIKVNLYSVCKQGLRVSAVTDGTTNHFSISKNKQTKNKQKVEKTVNLHPFKADIY